MHRFKFRVWDKETNKYYKSKISNSSGSVIYQHPSSNSCSWVGINTLFDDLEKDEENNKQTKAGLDFIIEQCTGLKDKNGKLIYEGDIVKVINGKYEYLYKVIWEDCAFVLKPTSVNDWEDTKYLEDWLCSSETFEVIGNIHENKDLLEDK